MSRVFFTSDLHLDHKRVIEYSKRPFGTVEEMNEHLISNWNSVVGRGDRVYVLGDFSLGKPDRALWFGRRLMGQKFLVAGNHDEGSRAHYESADSPFIWVKDVAYLTVEAQKIMLCHYAMLTWRSSHHGSWMLHGHSHGSLPDDPGARRLDVGVDVPAWNYTPVSFEQIKKAMSKKRFMAVDHHKEAID